MPPPTPLQPRDLSSTFAKGLRVMAAFDEAHPAMTLAEVAQATGFDRATVRRLLLTLVAEGIARQDGRRFSLTPRVLGFAGGYLRAQRVGAQVIPILNRFAAGLGRAISLAMADGDQPIYVAQSSLQDSAVSFGFTIGSRLPLLHTSLGRMMLAAMPPDAAQALIQTAPMQRYTPQSLATRPAVARAVDAARRDAVAVVRAEFEADVTGIAVPVGPISQVRAYLGTSVPSDTDAAPIIAALRACANALERAQALATPAT